jgi:glutathione reductase (NADPH)
MTTYDYDLFVIGAGSGGVRAARIAAGHGAKVAIAEEFRFGGTCVIRGCVPKKLLVYASRFHDDFLDAPGFGWTLPEPPTFSWASLIAAKDKEIARLEAIYRGNLHNAGVTIFESRAELEDAHTIRLVKDGKRVTAERILIATGGRPSLGDDISGRDLAITSNEAFHLEKLPRRIVIQGGGYIAVEFAGIFHGLGSEVTLVYRGEQILRGFDDDLRHKLAESYRRRGIAIVTGRRITAIGQAADGLTTTLDDGTTLPVDQVMMATGRVPNSAGLGLERAGVKLGWNGHIVVDEAQRSSIEGIYAVGDVTDRYNLTPVAIREGHAFADTVFGNKPWSTDFTLVPTAVFSTPEIGTVGLPEHLARERCASLDLYKADFRTMKATLSGSGERMFMKLIVDAESDRVVGVHVLGADAAEIVQMAAIAMRMGASKADFDATIALHPSAAEELVTMRSKWTAPAKAAE